MLGGDFAAPAPAAGDKVFLFGGVERLRLLLLLLSSKEASVMPLSTLLRGVIIAEAVIGV